MTNFPTSLPDNTAIPVGGTGSVTGSVSKSATAMRNELIAIAAKVGSDGSTDTTSVESQLSRVKHGDIKIVYNGSTFDTYDLKSNPNKAANSGAASLNAAMTFVKTLLGTNDTFNNGGRILFVASGHTGYVPITVPVDLRNCHCYEFVGEGDSGTTFQVSNVAAMQGVNDVGTTLSNSPVIGNTSFTITSATGWPTANFWVALSGTEKIFCTSRSGTTVTCEALTANHTSGDAAWAMGHKFAFDLRDANRIRFTGFHIDCNNVQGCGGVIQERIQGGATGGPASFSRIFDNSVHNNQAEAFSQGDYGSYLVGSGTSNAYWDRNNVFDQKAGSGGFGPASIYDTNRAMGFAMYNNDWHVSQPQVNRPTNGYSFVAWGSTGQLSGNSGHLASTNDCGPILILGGGASNSTFGTNIYLDNVGPAKTTLNGNITNSQTTLTLASTANAPTAPFHLLIGSEYILVGARSGTACSSMTRGQRGTSAASHTTADTIYFDGFAMLIAPDIGSKSSRLYFGDGVYINGNAGANEGGDIIYADLRSTGTLLRQFVARGIHGTGTSNFPARSILNASHPSRVLDVMVGGNDQVALNIVGSAIPYRRDGVNRVENTGAGGGATLLYYTDEATGRVAASQTRTTTTLTDVTGLIVPMGGNCRYRVRGTLFYDAPTAGDIKVAIATPAGATGSVRWTGLGTSASAATDAPQTQIQTSLGTSPTAVAFGGVGAGTAITLEYEGFVNLTNAGNISVQAAQNSASGTTTVQTDSMIYAASAEV